MGIQVSASNRYKKHFKHHNIFLFFWEQVLKDDISVGFTVFEELQVTSVHKSLFLLFIICAVSPSILSQANNEKNHNSCTLSSVVFLFIFLVETGKESERSTIGESEAFTSAHRRMSLREFEIGLRK